MSAQFNDFICLRQKLKDQQSLEQGIKPFIGNYIFDVRIVEKAKKYEEDEKRLLSGMLQNYSDRSGFTLGLLRQWEDHVEEGKSTGDPSMDSYFRTLSDYYKFGSFKSHMFGVAEIQQSINTIS